MIIGIGLDIIDIARIEGIIQRKGERFLNRLFTPYEQENVPSYKKLFTHYAKRFAAKEAFLKAMGTGLAKGISWQDLEVRNSEAGQPYFRIEGKAQEQLGHIIPKGYKPYIHVSLSDSQSQASAMVLIEAQEENKIA